MISVVQLTRFGADTVVEIRLQKPPLNIIDDELIAGLSAAVAELEEDDRVRCCILVGGAHFAAGADIKGLKAMTNEQIIVWNARLQQVFDRLATLPVPVIAAVRGAALGGGMELALAADYRIAHAKARLGLPEVTLGIVPGAGGMQRLTQIVGRSRAKELVMSGRILEADQAVELGIADEVVSDPLEAAHELAARFTAAPRLAVRAAKEAIDSAMPITAAGLALDRALLASTFSTDDADVGFTHFLAKRPGPAPFDA